MSAAVTDGVTVGHPCCAEHECKIPLSNTHNEYCEEHQHLGRLCCVNGCTDRRENGHKTCTMTDHRQQEVIRKERRRRVKKRSMPQTGDCKDDTESALNNRKKTLLDGTFNRKWTHNEQIMVRPCGTVIGRATFFNFESMGAVKVRSKHKVFVSTLTILLVTGIHT